MKTLDLVLSKYRVDGPMDSPVRFLTKEDGGKNFETVNEFIRYYSRSDEEFNFLPTVDRRFASKDVGIPGQYIAKIMSSLLRKTGLLDTDWREYRRDLLYRKYEHNIKFFPIGRQKDGEFPECVRSALDGVSKWEYESKAIDFRTNYFAELFARKPAKATIVLACQDLWRDVFKRIYPNLAIRDDGIGNMYAFLDSKSQILVYAYFPMFQRLPGSKNERATRLAEYVADCVALE